MEKKEEWIDVVGYENYYQVSNFGQIRNVKNNKNKILIGGFDKDGYHVVNLSKNNISNHQKVHRLILIAFLKIKDLSFQTNHKDKNRKNNNLENLEAITVRENQCHRSKNKMNTSKYIGVHFYKNYWRSQIYHNGKNIYLGIFKNELDAFLSRKNYEKENNIVNKYLS